MPGRRVVRHEAVEGGILRDLFDQAAKEALPMLAKLKEALVMVKALRDNPVPLLDQEEGSADAKGECSKKC